MAFDDSTNSKAVPQHPLSTSSSMIRDLKDLSPERWESFVLVYSPLIRFWIRRKGVHPQSVEDISQECLRTIFTGIEHFERNANHGSFRGWLRTIVHRRVVDHIRSNGHEHAVPHIVMDGIVQPAGRDPEDIEVEQQALHELKARAMELVHRSTAEKTWQMFWMSTVEEVPTAEIAARFNVTMDAVRVAKGRAWGLMIETWGFDRPPCSGIDLSSSELYDQMSSGMNGLNEVS